MRQTVMLQIHLLDPKIEKNQAIDRSLVNRQPQPGRTNMTNVRKA